MKNLIAKWTAFLVLMAAPVSSMAQENVSEYYTKNRSSMAWVLGNSNWTISALRSTMILEQDDIHPFTYSISSFGKCKVMGTLEYSDTRLTLIYRSETLVNVMAVDPKVRVTFFSRHGKRVERTFPITDRYFPTGNYPELDEFVYEQVIDTKFCD